MLRALNPAARGAAIIATACGAGVAECVAHVTACVEAVDFAKRTLTIKARAGDIVTLAVGPEVRNFDSMRVGGLVAVRYVGALTLELRKRGTARREHVVAEVVAVDPSTRSVRLRGPTRVVDLRVQDPEQFKRVEIGDQVEATYREAVAISIEPVTQP